VDDPEAFVERRIAALIADLESDDESLRWDAAGDIRDMGTAAAAAVPFLVKVLLDRRRTEFNFYARGMAADALGAIGPAALDAIPALIDCTRPDSELPEEGRWLRLRAAMAIFKIGGDPQVAQQVAGELLGDQEWWLRDHAVVLTRNCSD
jgi:HEAT repeat protein